MLVYLSNVFLEGEVSSNIRWLVLSILNAELLSSFLTSVPTGDMEEKLTLLCSMNN